MPRRPALPIALSVLLTASAGTAAAYLATGHTATLVVDGVPRSVDFRGSTALDVVAAAGMSAGLHDSLRPAAGESVTDGGTVVLRRGRPMRLVLDGAARTSWVTAASVDEALDQVGLAQDNLAVSVPRSQPIPLDGLRVRVRTPKDIVVTIDGTTSHRSSTGRTVRDALIEAGVKLDADDRLSPARTVPLSDGLRIRAVRVRTERVVVDLPVPFTTERRNDASLLSGTTRQRQAGVAGAQRRTTEKVYADGVLQSQKLVRQERTRQPVARVLAVGTKPRPAPQLRRSTGSAGGLNWAALAACESGGNPGAVSPNGLYYGLYQFSVGTWRGVGGAGSPASASPGEQTYRAQLLYGRSGRSPWPVCGRNL